MKPIPALNMMEIVAILHAAGETRAANRIERAGFLRLARQRLRHAREDLNEARIMADEEQAGRWLGFALAAFDSAEYWRAQARALTGDLRVTGGSSRRRGPPRGR